jgi:pimeloyl-ACP methyl ester carboxylesterase
MAMRSGILKVPGARLHYEVQGSGPVLLMIPGGPTDAGVFAGLAGFLADRYTVVPYDPRGNSRSVLDGPPEDQRMDVHGDDGAQLLAALSGEPAYVLGSSGGAQIGLNLAARHPGRVHTLVAHEPPCVELLPDAAKDRAFTEEVYDTYRREGVGPAMRKFETGAGLGDSRQPNKAAPQSPPSPEMQEAFGRIMCNLDFFLAYGIRPISQYVPDVATLRAGPVRVVVGVGETSTGQVAHRTAVALAERLGTAPVTFPGDHGGYGSQPAAFAERLHQVLRELQMKEKKDGPRK